MVYICVMEKKGKLIHLSKSALIYFSVTAAKAGTTAKPYIQNLLEAMAIKAK